MSTPEMSRLTSLTCLLKNSTLQYFDPILHPKSTPLKAVNLIGKCAYSSTRFAVETAIAAPRVTLQAVKAAPYAALKSMLSIRLLMTSDAKKNDIKFMQPLVAEHPHLISYASEELKDSFLFMVPLLEKHPSLIAYASEAVQLSPFMKKAILANPTLLKHAGESLRGNKKFIESLIQENPTLIEYATDSLKKDKDLMTIVVNLMPDLVIHAHDDLKDDSDFMQMVVKLKPSLISHASEKLKNTPFIMKLTLELDKTLIKLVPWNLRNDSQFMQFALKLDLDLIEYVSEELRDSQEFMQFALTLDKHLIEYASKELKNNLDFMQFVAQIDPILAKEHASKEVKKDSKFKDSTRDVEYMLVALHNLSEGDLAVIEEADERFTNDENFMLRVIKINPSLFPLASETLKNKLAFVLKSLIINPQIVEHIPESFRNIPQVMQAVISRDVSLVRHTGEKLRNNPDFMEPIIEQYPQAMEFAFPALMNVIETGSKSDLNEVISANNITLTYLSIRLAISSVNPSSPYLTDDNIKKIYRFVKFVENTAIKNPEILKYVNKTLLKDSTLMVSITSTNPGALPYLPQSILSDATIMTMIALNDPKNTLPYLSPEILSQLKKDSLFVAKRAELDIDSLKEADPSLLNNPKFMLSVIIKDPKALNYAGTPVLQHRDTMLEIAKNHPQALMDLATLPPQLKDDPDFMKEIVTRIPAAFSKIGPKLIQRLKDEECIRIEGTKWIQSFLGENKKLSNSVDPQFLQQLATNDYHILYYAPLSFIDDATRMKPLAIKHRQALKYIGKKLENNQKFFDELYEKHGYYVYKYASEEIKAQLHPVTQAWMGAPDKRNRVVEDSQPPTTAASLQLHPVTQAWMGAPDKRNRVVEDSQPPATAASL